MIGRMLDVNILKRVLRYVIRKFLGFVIGMDIGVSIWFVSNNFIFFN